MKSNFEWIFVKKGAKSGGEMESAQAKNQALRDAGAVVPTSYETFEGAIKETFEKLVSLLIFSRDFLFIPCTLLLVLTTLHIGFGRLKQEILRP